MLPNPYEPIPKTYATDSLMDKVAKQEKVVSLLKDQLTHTVLSETESLEKLIDLKNAKAKLKVLRTKLDNINTD